MNTKYKATAHLSSDSYNRFTAQTLSEFYDTVKSRVPFDSCKCTFTYCSDNTTVSADINDIPKNLNVQAFEFFTFDFSQNDDYITASFTPDSISVTVCLPIDFKSSKALAENLLILMVDKFKSLGNNNKAGDKKEDKFKRFLEKAVSYASPLIEFIKLIKSFF